MSGWYRQNAARRDAAYIGDTYRAQQQAAPGGSVPLAGGSEEERAGMETRYAGGRRRRSSNILTGGEGAPLGMGQIGRVFAGGL